MDFIQKEKLVISKKLIIFIFALSHMMLTLGAPGRRARTSGATIASGSTATIPASGNDNEVITITNAESGAVIATLTKTKAERKNMMILVNSDSTVTTFQVSKNDFRQYNNKQGSEQANFMLSLAEKYNARVN